MTHEQLNGFFKSFSPAFHMTVEDEARFLDFINQHVAEVIGEDEPNPPAGVYKTDELDKLIWAVVARSNLRAEQRRTAGIIDPKIQSYLDGGGDPELIKE